MKKDITILYVDDDYVNLFLFEKIFSSKFGVITTNSPSKGMKIIEERHADIKIVVSDYNMPTMDGLEFLKLVRLKFSHLKCFIYSNSDINEDILFAIERGDILEYFQKSISYDRLEKTFIRCLFMNHVIGAKQLTV